MFLVAPIQVIKQQQYIQKMQGELQQCQQVFQYTSIQYDTLKNTQKFKDELLERVFNGGLGDEQVLNHCFLLLVLSLTLCVCVCLFV